MTMEAVKKIANEIEIIHEDTDLLVLNKPSGLIVNRSKTTKEKTLQDYLDEYLDLPHLIKDWEESPELEIFVQRSGLAHRLDKGTSGVLLVGKTPKVLATLMDQFKQRELHKEYLALVHGKIKDQKIEIQAPLGRNPQSRFKFAIVEEGKPAKTVIELVKSKEGYTLVTAKPETGRTHQIRVHLAALNHPIAGDTRYCPRNFQEKDSREIVRLMLHARKITLIHPLSRKEVTYTAEIPQEFLKYY